MYIQGENYTRIASDIANTITQQITARCQCPYTSSFIVDDRFICDDNQNELIYQGQFLGTSRRTSDEILGLVQDWVLTQPTVLINSQPYMLDSSCSVTVNNLGTSSCGSSTTAIPTANATPRTPSTYELAAIAGVGLILLLIVIVVICLTVYIVARRSKKKNNNQDTQGLIRYEYILRSDN